MTLDIKRSLGTIREFDVWTGSDKSALKLQVVSMCPLQPKFTTRKKSSTQDSSKKPNSTHEVHYIYRFINNPRGVFTARSVFPSVFCWFQRLKGVIDLQLDRLHCVSEQPGCTKLGRRPS